MGRGFHFLILLFAFIPTVWAGRQFPAQPGEQVVPGEYLVHLVSRVSSAASALGLPAGSTVSELRRSNIHLVKLPAAAFAAQASLANHPLVDFIEPNRLRRITLQTPNDTSFAQQWALQNIQAQAAWSLLPGRYLTSSTVPMARTRVAVLDTGIDCTHPDFKTTGGTSTDSALGGQISFGLSRAYVATTIASPACTFQDDHGHGTHTAGTVAAAVNNALGVASLAYPIDLIVYKVLDSTGSGRDSVIATAIMDAADAGAKAISLSLGGTGYSQTLQTAVTYAWQRGALVVAAAGNSNNSSPVVFPGGANHAVSVAATDSNDQKASFSNFGTSIDIAAPGVSILSTLPTYPNPTGVLNYAYMSGTSMATPHVAALAGMLALSTPSLSPDAILQRIQQSAASSIANGGWDENFGYGIIRAGNALAGTLRTATRGSIVGQVVDASQFPLSGILLTVNSSSLTTDSTGLFRFSNLSAGTYTLSASSASVATQNLGVVVPAGADTTVTVTMGITPGTFAGSVTRAGVPVPGVSVQALAGGLVQAAAFTGQLGQYTLSVPAGAYDLQANGLSKTTTTVSGQIVAGGGTQTVNLTLPNMGSVAGSVRDSNQNPIVGAAILVAGGGYSVGAITDVNGAYSTIGLPAGLYSVTASANGYSSSTADSIPVAVDAVATVDLVLANLPAGTGTDGDIGSPGLAGSGSLNGGVYTLTGSGSDIWSSSDQFHFYYWTMNGDGTMTARVTSQTNTDVWAKAGVMIRETLSANSTYAIAAVTPANGLTMQYRAATGAPAAMSAQVAGGVPMWVRLVRTGNSVQAYTSANGTSWNALGGATSIPMAATVYVGLAVCAHNSAALSTATFDNVTPGTPVAPDFTIAASLSSQAVTAGNSTAYTVTVGAQGGFTGVVSFGLSGLPSGATGSFNPATVTGSGSTTLTVTTSAATPVASSLLTLTGSSGSLNHAAQVTLVVNPAGGGPGTGINADIGSPGLAGSGSLNGGVYTLTGSGSDIWSSSDQFHFYYWTMSGDGAVTARVTSQTNTDGWAKAGVMIRETLSANSAYAIAAVTPANWLTMQYRAATGASAATSGLVAGGVPMWVRLVRTGSSVQAYTSANGTSWNAMGGATSIPMAATVYVGLAVCAHNSAALSTATFDNVTPGTPVTPDFTIAASPSSQAVTAGNSTTYTVTVGAQGGFTGVVSFGVGGLPSGATGSFNPATVTGSGNTTLTVTTSAGTPVASSLLTLTGSSGSLIHAAQVTLVVNPAGGGPGTGINADVGSPGLAGSGSVNGSVYTLTGSGSDIWSSSDQFHFYYWAMSGDGAVTARVTSQTNTDVWAKAGVMIRETLSANSAYAIAAVTPANWLTMQYRAATGASAATSGLVAGGVPMWVRLVRTGNSVQAYTSANGTSWNAMGGATSIPMAATVYVGLAVCAHNSAALSTATFDNVTPGTPVTPDFTIAASPSSQAVTAGNSTTYTVTVGAQGGFTGVVSFGLGGLPSGATGSFNPATVTGSGSTTLTVATSAATPVASSLLTLTGSSGSLNHAAQVTLVVNPAGGGPGTGINADIGSPGLAGSGSLNGGVYTLTGSGSDIWSSSDQFHFYYWTMNGDGTVTARVTSQTNTDAWAKAGVMIRETLSANSAFAIAAVTPANGLTMQYRAAMGASAAMSAQVVGSVPMWVRLVRTGSSVQAYTSANGTSWNALGGATAIPMAGTVYVGLAVTAHNSAALSTATFDNVEHTSN